MAEHFHFLAPWWLLALVPLLLLAWRAYRPGGGDNPWRRVVDAPLLPLLMIDRARSIGRAAPSLLGIAWTIAVLALANPTWERQPQRVYQTTAARVIVLDLSRTMDASDLPPSRLARARYRIEDILALSSEGQTGLVAYSGDAFTVSPLTRDGNTISALLRALDPGIMPTQGSRADLGLLKARDLLRQAGSTAGQILLIADGIEPDSVAATQRAAADLKKQGYRVSVVGVGAPTTDVAQATAAPAAGAASTPAFDATALQSVANAGGGEYQSITASGDALKSLLSDTRLLQGDAVTSDDAATQGWKERGPFLVLLLLPLAALAFRRNWLLIVLLFVGVASPPKTALASTWDDLWQRPDQQAAKAMVAGDYAAAAKVADDPSRRGSAEYRLGNYDKAAEAFARTQSAEADYNRGNALAKLGRYDEAIAAYDKSLQANGANEDARANKAAVERLRQQQQAKSPPQGDKQEDKQGDNEGDTSQSSTESKRSPGEKPQPGQNDTAQNQASKDGHDAGKDDKKGGKQNDSAGDTSSPAKDSQQSSNDKSHGQQATGPDASQPKDAARNQFSDAAKQLAADQASAKKNDDGQSAAASQRGRSPAPAIAADADAHKRAAVSGDARPLESEEQMAAEQWLRRIPDDPGGLLRRKFLYQYRQRAQANGDAQ